MLAGDHSQLIVSAFRGYSSYIKHMLSDGSKALDEGKSKTELDCVHHKKILIFIMTQDRDGTQG